MITAKFKVTAKDPVTEKTEIVNVGLIPDYTDERNKAWAPWTPGGSISLGLRPSVAEQFPVGNNFLVTFTDEDEGI